VTVVGVTMALWCAGFAAISIWFEVTDYFGTGEYAEYASGFSVVNWIVTAIKVVGAAVALLAVARRPNLLAPRAVGTLLWAAFTTITIYVLGSALQAALMLTGLAGDADRIDAASVAYLLLFILAAAGFGILAVSYARRAELGKREILLGAVGAPIVLGGVLVVVPTILAAAGMLPAA
jgi:hypothetical protein